MCSPGAAAATSSTSVRRPIWALRQQSPAGRAVTPLRMTAAATLTDASFLHAASIETLRLTGASTITLGANAASAGLVNVTTGSGATSITELQRRHAQCRCHDAGREHGADADRLGAETVTDLVGNITASSLTGALSVTTGDAADDGIAITTGSAATTVTDNFSNDTVAVTATALAQNTNLTLAGSAAEVGDRPGRKYRGRFPDRDADRDHGQCGR